MQIDNRVFIVTGASSGIGLATATALTDRGAKVALLARSTEALEELSGFGVHGLAFQKAGGVQAEAHDARRGGIQPQLD